MENTIDLISRFNRSCKVVLLSNTIILLNIHIKTATGIKPKITATAAPGREEDILTLYALYVSDKDFIEKSSFFKADVCLPHCIHHIS